MVENYLKLSEELEPDRSLIESTYWNIIERAKSKDLVIDMSTGIGPKFMVIISINGDPVKPEDVDYILNSKSKLKTKVF